MRAVKLLQLLLAAALIAGGLQAQSENDVMMSAGGPSEPRAPREPQLRVFTWNPELDAVQRPRWDREVREADALIKAGTARQSAPSQMFDVPGDAERRKRFAEDEIQVGQERRLTARLRLAELDMNKALLEARRARAELEIGPISVSSADGRELQAIPLALDAERFTFALPDGRVFLLPLERFAPESIEQIEPYRLALQQLVTEQEVAELTRGYLAYARRSGGEGTGGAESQLPQLAVVRPVTLRAQVRQPEGDGVIAELLAAKATHRGAAGMVGMVEAQESITYEPTGKLVFIQGVTATAGEQVEITAERTGDHAYTDESGNAQTIERWTRKQ
jgi:hypothetical protein